MIRNLEHAQRILDHIEKQRNDMKPGIYANHARDRYDAFGAVNWSTLKALKKSPKHYQACLQEPPADTDAFAFGRLVHVVTLEPEQIEKVYAVWDGGDRRGKAWEAFRLGHADREIIRQRDLDSAIRLAREVRNHPLVRPYLNDGDPEVSVVWERAGVTCKGRLDWVSRSKPALLDLKTTSDITEARFTTQAARLGYHGQSAFYSDGYKRHTDQTLPYVIVAVESALPHDVAVYVYDPDALYAGDEEIDDLLELLKRCRETDEWPGMYQSELTLRLPRWMYADDEDGEVDLSFSRKAG